MGLDCIHRKLCEINLWILAWLGRTFFFKLIDSRIRLPDEKWSPALIDTGNTGGSINVMPTLKII